jgi:hypothetical protein
MELSHASIEDAAENSLHRVILGGYFNKKNFGKFKQKTFF